MSTQQSTALMPRRGRVLDEVRAPNGRWCQLMDVSDDAPPAPFPMCFTEGALALLLAQVGDHKPEAGALLFGPKDSFGTDVVEKDFVGSRTASQVVFAPDPVWGTNRMRYWLDRPSERMRLNHGVAHSHPGDAGRPSRAVGPGLGDLGFVAAWFEANFAHQFYCLPILTSTGRSRMIRIYPWMLCRDDPHTPMAAQFVVGPVAKFPTRVFNPELERLIADEGKLEEPTRIDVRRFADLFGGKASTSTTGDRSGSLVVDASRDGLQLKVEIPRGFPLHSPNVRIVLPNGRYADCSFHWAGTSDREPERRLAHLCDALARVASSIF